MRVLSILILFVAYAHLCCEASYAPNHGGSLLFEIVLPKQFLEDFEYVPTKEGYRYRYRLADGTTREEIGLIPNTGTDDERTMANDDTRTASRPRGSVNRKLSPKSLQSLAG